MQCNAMQCNAMQCNAMYVCIFMCVYAYIIIYPCVISTALLDIQVCLPEGNWMLPLILEVAEPGIPHGHRHLWATSGIITIITYFDIHSWNTYTHCDLWVFSPGLCNIFICFQQWNGLQGQQIALAFWDMSNMVKNHTNLQIHAKTSGRWARPCRRKQASIMYAICPWLAECWAIPSD